MLFLFVPGTRILHVPVLHARCLCVQVCYSYVVEHDLINIIRTDKITTWIFMLVVILASDEIHQILVVMTAIIGWSSKIHCSRV